MKKELCSCLLALSLAVPAASLCLPSLAGAASDREEVAERLELNQVSAEQLAATGAVDLETAKKIMELRDQLGSFQSYEDLEELNIPEDTFKQLQYNTTISGIAADCNC